MTKKHLINDRHEIDVCPCGVEKTAMDALIAAVFAEGKQASQDAVVSSEFIRSEFTDFYYSIIEGNKEVYEEICGYLAIDREELDKILTTEINPKKGKLTRWPALLPRRGLRSADV